MKQTPKLLMALLFAVISISSYAQVSGVVFRDYNGNGSRQTAAPTIEPPVPGVLVRAYNSANQQVGGTKTTDAAGAYSFTGLTLPLRIEFEIPASGSACVNSAIDFSAQGANAYGSSVQFVSTASASINFGINNPADYINGTNPWVFGNQWANGNPSAAGTSQSATWFYGFPYSNSGTGTPPSKKLTGATIGSTWGVAYSKQAKKIFTSAFLKRHVGLGTLGTGGIYILDTTATSFTATGFYDMDTANSGAYRTRANAISSPPAYGSGTSYTLNNGGTNSTQVTYLGTTDPASGFPLGFGVVGSNVARGLNTDYTTQSNDPATFDQVGKVGIGDIEISDDGKYLFVMNLYDRKVYRLTLNNAYNPTSVTAVTSYTIPNPPLRNSISGFSGVTGYGSASFYDGTVGYQRPFALKYYRGKLYVGAVTTGENGGTNTLEDNTGTPEFTDLWAFAYQLDAPTGAASFTSTPIVAYPLNYNKGAAMTWTTPDYAAQWYPWTANTSVTVGASNDRTYPTPQLTDMEFSDKGDLIMSFSDRSSNQFGWWNYRNLSGTAIIGYPVGGDILIAGRSCSGDSYTLENNGSYVNNGTTFSSGAANNQGPGNSEFFKYEALTGTHDETALGALAILRGDNKVMLTNMDPNNVVREAGTSKFSLVDGTETDPYRLYISANDMSSGTFGKSGGLGDIELVESEAPIEIGNRIWKDNNANGIQDASESGLANVTVQLYTNGANGTAGDGDDVLIGTTTTNSTGNYYFTSASGTDGGGVDYGVSISQNTAYNIRIGSADWTGGEGVVDLSGYTLTPKDQVSGGLVDVADNDAAFNASVVPMITVTTGNFGENNHTLDFGFRLGSIGDKVWLDTNKDGTQDAGEVGVSGVTVTLYNNSNVVIATTKTDATGNYLFNNLPVSAAGTNYQVKFELPAQYQFTTQSGGVTTTTNSDANTATGRTTNISLTTAIPDVIYVDAGLIPTLPTRIGDFIWYDVDGDGVQDAGEQGISGVTVTLYDNAGNPVRSTITDNNGHYEFTEVTPGTYTLGITPPIGYGITTKDQGGDDTKDSDFDPTTFRNASFVVTSGTDNLTFDGGLIKQSATLASLGDKVWYDIDADGVQDADETGVQGVTVELYNTSNVLIATKTTDALGNYILNGLTPGGYYVKFSNLPAGYTLTTANAGSNDNIDADVDGTHGAGTTPTYTLVAGQTNMSVDAGIQSPAATYSIGDKVWYDLDKDGVQDAPATTGENGVPGVTVILYNSAGSPVDSTTTNASGNYLFTGLAAGTYSVGFTALPKGYGFTTLNADAAGISGTANSDVNPYTGITASVTIGGGNPNPRYVDAGIIASPVQSQDIKASLGDKVWNDLNNDGLQTAGEPGVAGVIVTLYAADGTTVLGRDTTDALGNYLFTNLNGGTYVVGFTNLPATFVFATQNAGTDDTKDSDPNTGTGKTGAILLQPGQANLTVDAGIRTATPKSALGDKVWYDLDSDGIQDAGEPGVPGVSVTLFDGTGAFVKSTTTDNVGNYLFTDLNAGTYQIGFSNLPTGFSTTTKDASGFTAANGSDADAATLLTGSITLAATTTDLTWDMGIVAAAGLGAIGDYVWYDANGNGIQDATELPAAGILVTLYDNTNTAIGTAITDGSGFYFFPNLPVSAGGIDYTVGFSNLPANATFTTKGAGTAATNSDVNIATGKTDVITLTTANPVRTDIDAGIVSNFAAVGNYVWYDVNNNGSQDATEIGVPGNLVTFYNAGANGAIGGGDDFIVSSAITDGNGGYFINNIPITTCTNFYMQFTAVPSNPFTTQNADAGGINGGANSDVNVSGQTGIFSLCAEQVNPNIDAGLRNVPLPVQGLNISANLVGTTATINWSTENEISTAKFIVERSIDNTSFTYVGEKQGQGNFTGTTKYQLNDNISTASAAVIYYRIKAVDMNGKITYSKVVVVRVNHANEVKAWPNPFVDKLTISVNADAATTLRVRLIDYTGKTILSNAYSVVKGNNQLNIGQLKTLAKGVYMLKVEDTNARNILIRKLTKD